MTRKTITQRPTDIPAAELPPEAYDTLPRATLTLTRETIWLTRHDERGMPLCTYPVSSRDVGGVFNNFGADTGLLPEGILFWQMRGNSERVGVYVPPARREIRVMQGRRERKLTIPLPGLVFVGQGVGYSVYAALTRPLRPQDPLYHAPFPNVYADGRICMGNTQPPVCSVATMGAFLRLWWESDFTLHLGDRVIDDPRPILKFYESIQHKRQFPVKALIPSIAMAQALGEGTSYRALRQEPIHEPLNENPGDTGEDDRDDDGETDEGGQVVDAFFGPIGADAGRDRGRHDAG